MNRRTSLTTAAAVTGTILAGSAAVAANIGVLSAAEGNSIGNLSAEATVASPTTIAEAQVVDIYLEDPLLAPTDSSTSTTITVADTPEATSQEFAVESAGIVTVEQDATGVRVSGVDANAGWLWKTEQSSPTELLVIFASSNTIYEFHASVDENGVVDARVDEPIVNVVQVPGPAPAPAPSGSSTSPAAEPAPPPPAAPSYDADRPDHSDDDHDEEDDHDELDDHEDDHDEVDEVDEEDEEDEHEVEEHEGGDDDD
jgi:hypothetical protein